MNKFLIAFILLLPIGVFAQPGVAPVEEVDGKRYYAHKVEPGNTLYGLSRVYGLSVDEIVATNPMLKEGLKVGQKVLIPVTEETISQMATMEYKVKKSETLYGLSKKFNISIDDMFALNPELKDGLKKGQIIKVPKSDDVAVEVVETNERPSTPNPFVTDTTELENGVTEHYSFTFSDSTVRHIVLAHETMYSVSKRFMVSIEEIMDKNGLTSTSIKEGQVLIIPVKTERIERVEIKPIGPLDNYDPNGEGALEFPVKDEYNVVMLLPFYTQGAGRSGRKVSNYATQFYMGARMALDSLEKKGARLNVRVLDSKNDSSHVASLLSDTAMLHTDLFIGPFFQKNIEPVAAFCKENRIRLVAPVSVNDDFVDSNRLIYQGVQSKEGLMELLAIHMLENHAGDHIVLVKPTKESDMSMYEAFKETFQTTPYDGERPVLVESTTGSFTEQIRRGVNTRFVIPTNDRTTAMKFLNSINRSAFRSRPKNLFVYGTKDWSNYGDLNNAYKNKYNFHFASPNFLDYYTDEVVSMNKQHRDWYKTDLSRMAVHGYDIVSYFCSQFFLDGHDPYLMMSKFEMTQMNPKGGYKNRDVYVVVQDEFELFDSEVPRED